MGAGAAVVRVTQHYRTPGPFGAGDWGIGIGESQKQGGPRSADPLLPIPIPNPGLPQPPAFKAT